MVEKKERVLPASTLLTARKVARRYEGERCVPRQIVEVMVVGGFRSSRFGSDEQAMATRDHRAQRRPRCAGGVHVGEFGETARCKGPLGLCGGGVILDDQGEHFV